MKAIKAHWGAILTALLLIAAVFFGVSNLQHSDGVQAEGLPPCERLVRVTGLVDLARPLELHQADNAIPCGCEAVTGQLWQIDQIIPAKLKTPDSIILSRIKSPAPDRVLIGEWITYEINEVKNPNCKPDKVPTKPIPKDKPAPVKPKPGK